MGIDRRRLVILGLALLLLSACARGIPPKISSFTSEAAVAPGRVAVLPLTRSEGVGRSALALDEDLRASLRELGHHEVIAVPLAAAAVITPEAAQRNQIPVQALLALRDATRADAVLVGRIEQFRPFDPVAVGLSMALISCQDGAVLWSATAHFDGARAGVQEDVEQWYGTAAGSIGETPSGWRQTLATPSRFGRYACDRLLATMEPQKKE
jgi:hypothetical protein